MKKLSMAIYDESLIINFEGGGGMVLDPLPQPPNVSGFKDYIVKEQDTLLSISNNHFKDTSKWYRLAELNLHTDIFNPEPGTKILIPHE